MNRLEQLIREENALSSFDLIYFLLVPVVLFVIAQLPRASTPDFRFLVILFLPSGIISLPFGIHAKLTNSVAGRIRAWAIWIYMSVVGYWLLSLPYFTEKASPVSAWVPFLTLYSLEDYVFSLGVIIVSLALGRMWMKWIYSVFEKRLPSRKSELARAKEISFVRILLKGNADLKYEISPVVMGLSICVLAFAIRVLHPG